MPLTRYPRVVPLSENTEITLRPLREDDTEKLIELFQGISDEDILVMGDNVADSRTIESWTRQIDHERALTIVAELDDRIVGEATMYRRPNTPHASIGQMRLYVSEEMRHNGLGGHLLDDMIELGRDLGLSQLVVEMFIENTAMISAFQRRGFESEASLPVYQMVVMRYNLVRRPGREVSGIDHAGKLPSRQDWPDLLFDETLFEIPAELNLAEMLLDRIVEEGRGGRPAIYFRHEVVSYELLLEEVQRLTGALARLGVKEGDAVLLHLPNTPQAIAANFAVQRLGGLSVPTPPQFSARELAFVVAESGAVAAITTTDLLGEVRQIRTEETTLGPIVVQGRMDDSPDENIYSYARLIARGGSAPPPRRRSRNQIGLLLYTSADSGHPRGTAHRLDGLLAAVDTFGRHVWRVNEEDVVGSLAPLGFAQGFVTCGMLPFYYGASVALPDDSMASTGEALAETIRRHRITLLLASPVVYREILAEPRIDVLDLASLRLCSSGGEPLTVETYQAWQERFEQPIFEGFGTTELLYAFLSNAVGMAPRPGSLGRVVPGYEVKVLGDLGNDLQPGEIGYLVVRGPTGTLYWNNPDAQRRSVRNGWNQLSDYGLVDPDGYFWFVARSDDLIKSRSYRIDPSEVEAALREHPHVKEAAVIGLHDEMRGQRPVAYVVAGEREEAGILLARSILGSLNGRLADYKIPDEVRFVEALPRNAQGQLLRRVLRDQVRRQQEE